MADSQKATSLRLYGNPDTRTPTLDALAARGVWACHCIAPHPFCFPSRCSLHTGRYPHAHGVRGNARSLPPEEVPLAVLLQQAGYRTGAAGHFHGRAGGARGFDIARDMGEGRQREAWRLHHELVRQAPRRSAHMTATVPALPEEDIDGVITADALSFLDEVPADAPYFLQVAWIAPHPPSFVPAPYDSLYDPGTLTYPAQEPDDADKPLAYRQTAIDMGTWDAPAPELRRALAAHYGMVSLLDDQVARVLDHLQERGRLRDTIIVYTSDHGDYAGEHGMWGKSCTLYDALIRVPLIIAAPDGLLPAGRALDGMVQSIDLLPTLLELLGLPIPDNVHGLSLRPLWEGREPPGRPGGGRTGFDVAFAEVGAFPPSMVHDRQRGDNVPFGPSASGRQNELSVMARTADWKLVYTPGRETQELYDLRTDPGELRNRYADPALAPVAAALRSRLQDWLLAHT